MKERCVVCGTTENDVTMSMLPRSKYRRNGVLLNDEYINQAALTCEKCFDKLWETKYHPLIKGFYRVRDNKVISTIKRYEDSGKIYIERPRPRPIRTKTHEEKEVTDEINKLLGIKS